MASIIDAIEILSKEKGIDPQIVINAVTDAMLVAARKKFGDRAEFLVVAVAVNQSRNSVRRHLERHPMPFTFLWDGNGAAVRAFQAPSTSYVAVLDAKGRVSIPAPFRAVRPPGWTARLP